MTEQDLASAIRDYVSVQLVPLTNRIAELESSAALATSKLAVLEARPELKYCGVWQEGTTYTTANLVTRSGALWLSTFATTSKPGTDSSWRLIVKTGAA